MIQTQENSQKPHFWAWFKARWAQIPATIFFYKTSSLTLFQAIILSDLKEN